MARDRILNLIGLAMKAGKVVSGEFSVEKCIKSGKARLVIIASDASENTKKKFEDKCKFYHVPILIYSTKEDLGMILGKGLRSSKILIILSSESYSIFVINPFGSSCEINLSKSSYV